MKTATVPNSPELEELFHLTAEIDVAQEDLDRWHHQEINVKLNEIIDLNCESIRDEFHKVGIEEYNEPLVRQFVMNTALKSAETITTHVSMMERRLGLVASYAPAELAKQALEDCMKYQLGIINAYWEQP